MKHSIHYALPLLGNSIPSQPEFSGMTGFIYQINGPQEDATFVTRIHPSLGEIDYDHFAVPAKFNVKRKVLTCTADDLPELTYGKDYIVLDSYWNTQNDEPWYQLVDDRGQLNYWPDVFFVTKITNQSPFHSVT